MRILNTLNIYPYAFYKLPHNIKASATNSFYFNPVGKIINSLKIGPSTIFSKKKIDLLSIDHNLKSISIHFHFILSIDENSYLISRVYI